MDDDCFFVDHMRTMSPLADKLIMRVNDFVDDDYFFVDSILTLKPGVFVLAGAISESCEGPRSIYSTVERGAFTSAFVQTALAALHFNMEVN